MEDIAASPRSQSSHSSFSRALLISMFGMVVTCFAILLYHILLVKYCVRRHISAATAAESAAERPFIGVEEKVLRTIPILAFSAVKGDMDLDECAVCLGELEDEDAVRLLPKCNHAFHVTCIDQWFATKRRCPLCRSPVVPEDTHSEPSPVDDDGDGGARFTNDSDLQISEQSTMRDANRESSVPFGSLHHCTPLMASPPADRRPSPPRLTRSLSMDQSLIATTLQRNSLSSCSSGSLRRIGSCSNSTCSPSHFDHGGSFSAKWLWSFSRLGLGKGTSNREILPY